MNSRTHFKDLLIYFNCSEIQYFAHIVIIIIECRFVNIYVGFLCVIIKYMIIWFTGLSGSGKSTLSDYLKKTLEKVGSSVCQVDGDAIRQKNKTSDKFSREHIIENNLGIIEYCQKIKNDYDFLIVAVISPYRQTRDYARRVFGKDYLEIFLNCPLEILVKNDVKGLYKKAQKNEIINFIGFHKNSPYEIPKNPDLEIRTDKISIGDSVKKILCFLYEKYGIKI